MGKYLNQNYSKRLVMPENMISGFYKYIVFEEIERSTGKVYDQPCHQIMGKEYTLPNTEWVAQNHWCVPIYYKGANYNSRNFGILDVSLNDR